MRVKLIRNRDGEACEALVTLTERERALVLNHAVPMLYAPGGMAPERERDLAAMPGPLHAQRPRPRRPLGPPRRLRLHRHRVCPG